MRQPDASPASPIASPSAPELQRRAQNAALKIANAGRAALSAINDQRWLIAHDIVDRVADDFVDLVDALDVLDGRSQTVGA